MNQFNTLLWLRYRLFRGSLQSRETKLGAWAGVLGLSLLGLLALGAGSLIFMGLIVILLPRKAPLEMTIAAGLWAVLWFQVLTTVLAQATGAGAVVDPRRFLLYPIPLARLFTLNGLTTVADVSCWPLLPATVALLLAPTVYFQSGWGVVLVLLGVLWLGVVGFTLNLVLAWLLGQGGQRREVTTALLIGGVSVLPQVFLVIQARFPQLFAQWRSVLSPWQGLLKFLPPQALAIGMAELQQGQLSGLGLALVVVLGWCLGLLALGYWCFGRLALQVETGGTKAGRTSWHLPDAWWGLSTGTGAILNKQLRYLGRNPLSYFLLVPVVVVFGGLGLGISAESFREWGGLWVLVGVSNGFLFSAQFANNMFGFDGPGFKTYLLSPVPWQQVLLAHNLAQGVWILPQVFGGVLLLQGLTGGLRLDLLPLTVMSVVVLGVVYSLLGNWFSILVPTRLEFGVQRRRRNFPLGLALAPLAGLGVNLVVLLPLVLLVLGAHWLQNTLLLQTGTILIMGIALLVYPAGLNAQASWLETRQDQVLERLSSLE
ncbi:hypothetical protein [Candidatus Cyanaurora vandensis]|uniref:hypothetical protein n=1 Tax=Candidatus Cyanaurora vandensis TaxID=2714958 RepID=UPI00257B741A|nr:hypothetical protein [Candidatus Cyanaurora vandensis]